jgi:two-component system OmpR family sensor kinase
MTLRWRLALALAALLAVGLTLFGVATFVAYGRSQYQHLDDQLAASVGAVSRQLYNQSGYGGGPFGHPPGRPDGDEVSPLGSYGELRDSSGAVIARTPTSSSTPRPKLPDDLPVPASYNDAHYFTTGSTTGSGQWRVVTTRVQGPAGDGALAVAAPLGDVQSSLNRLALIEVAGGLALLAILTAGSLLILRRGLRPLEQMATTAGEITAGDLSQRVTPSGGPTEVGRLGLALNTMLDDIEDAFHEREATEARLRRFLADASHELRTPITSIQGFAELFRVDPDNAKVDLPTILRRIEDESGRMRLLVEDLLLLARLDQTRPIEPAPVDLSVLAADACTDAVASARDRAVTLDAPAPVVVAGVEVHLRQAIANLLANAMTHTPAGSPIEVTVGTAAGMGTVSVRDHGPGLDAEAIERVFDRFWQADAARVGQGAGLGLSIVTGIAAEHGGQASVRNVPGGGAEFTLAIPLRQPGAAPVPIAPPEPS